MGKTKNSDISISLVIPTYNDEKTIVGQVLACEKILQKTCSKYEIIIAEDHGTDNTWNLLNVHFGKKREYRLIQNKQNMGITKNVQQLYSLAKMDFVLFYSADGDWNPQDTEKMIDRQIETGADIVIGKRIKKNGYTPYRHLISTLHRLLPLILLGVDTIDPGGIKLIRRDLAQAKLSSKSQLFEAEIIIRAKRAGKKVTWSPVSYNKPYTGAGFGGGFNSALESGRDLLKLRMNL